MLCILATEVRHVGLEPGEQLRHHGGDSLEVTRPTLALHTRRHVGHDDRREGFRRIHLAEVWSEQNVGTRRSCKLTVPFEITRVTVEVGGIVELERVDEQ